MAALNVSNEPLKNMSGSSRFQADIVQVKTILVFVEKRREDIKDKECIFPDCLNSGLSLSCLIIAMHFGLLFCTS
jgi:hypothetical protein